MAIAFLNPPALVESSQLGGIAGKVLGDCRLLGEFLPKQLEQAADHALDAQRRDSVTAAAQDYFELAFAQAAVGAAAEAVRISTNYETQMRHAVQLGIALKRDLLRVSVKLERNELALQGGRRFAALSMTRGLSVCAKQGMKVLRLPSDH